MAEQITTVRFVDLILIVVALEAMALLAYWRIRRRGVAPKDLLPNLFAGVFLLLAMRTALIEGSWMAVGAFLAAAGMAHVADVIRRWRR